MKVRPGSMGKPFPGITGTVLDPNQNEPYRRPTARSAWSPSSSTGRRGCGPTGTTRRPSRRSSGTAGTSPATGPRIDKDGYFWFVGRDDDIINTAGHLVSPFEVESALLEHPAVAESAVVSKPDPINIEVVKAFVTLKPGFTASKDLDLEIMNFIRKKLSPLAMPQEIEFVDALPKTRSGKIMRRILHAKEWGEEIGDTSTLEND